MKTIIAAFVICLLGTIASFFAILFASNAMTVAIFALFLVATIITNYIIRNNNENK